MHFILESICQLWTDIQYRQTYSHNRRSSMKDTLPLSLSSQYSKTALRIVNWFNKRCLMGTVRLLAGGKAPSQCPPFVLFVYRLSLSFWSGEWFRRPCPCALRLSTEELYNEAVGSWLSCLCSVWFLLSSEICKCVAVDQYSGYSSIG